MPRPWERILGAVAGSLVGVATVFQMASDIVSTPEALVRPVVVATLLGGATFGAFLLVTKRWALATIFSCGLMMFTFRQSIPGLVLLVLGLWWVAIESIRRRSRQPELPDRLPNVTARAAGVFSVVLVVLSGWTLAEEYRAGVPEVRASEFSGTGVGGPDVYLLMLDGYPRADTLRDTFGFNATPFTDRLGDLGFQVSDHARANYNKTWLTLASLFNANYVDRIVDMDAIPASSSLQIRWLQGMIAEATALDAFRDRGYTIATIPSAFTSTELANADLQLGFSGLTELEVRLISSSPWAQVLRGPVLEFLRGDHADSVRASLAAAATFAETPRATPALLFAHIHSPHTPFVLHPPDTEPAEIPECMPTRCNFWNATIDELGMPFQDFEEGLVRQLEVLNDELLTTVGRIIEADPEAIIVLFSDHGIRYSLTDVSEHYRVFFAARVPGEPDLFDPDQSPVDILRRILGHLGEDVEPLPYERWLAEWSSYLALRLTTDTP